MALMLLASAMVLTGTVGLVSAGAEEVTELPREETLYFGDNMNDLPAFKHAGITGTVENAREEVKAEADIIAGRFEDLGVLRELEGLFGASEE